jgi:radical SAM-linked protein
MWERIFRRALIPISYSDGFTPRPKISIAVPLAIGMTSEYELMDIWLSEMMSVIELENEIQAQLPDGLIIYDIHDVENNGPALQSLLLHAEYDVIQHTDRQREDIQTSIKYLLAKEELSWHHARGEKTHYYDLRKLVDSVWIIDYQTGKCVLGMRLLCGDKGSGRPEQVIRALNFDSYPESIHRNRLIIQDIIDSN